jgi:protein-S-isoprenylcysteine O-methyltransferase Ste14
MVPLRQSQIRFRGHPVNATGLVFFTIPYLLADNPNALVPSAFPRRYHPDDTLMPLPILISQSVGWIEESYPMDQLFLQAQVIAISLLGVVAIIPGPDKKGNLRIKGPLNNVISYVGIAFLLGPWLAIPFLTQPRYIGDARTIMAIAGFGLGLAGATLYALSLKMLLPAFRGQFSEFTPGELVIMGPYQYVRHPIYLSCLMILFGVYTALGASLSIIFLPLCYLLLKLVTIYEEKWILIPRFSTEYLMYRERVKSAILGTWGGLVFTVLYLLLAGMSLGDLMNMYDLPYIK